MKTNTTTPAEVGNLSAVEKKHINELRVLSGRRFRAVLRFARVLLESEQAAQKVEKKNPFDSVLQIITAEEARQAGKHLRLVVDNDRGAP